MTRLRHLLQSADPLRYESDDVERGRDRLRQTIMAAASAGSTSQHVRHRMSLAVLVTVASVIVALVIVGSQIWLRAGGTVQAAVRFEVRLAEDQPAAGLEATRVAANRTIYLHREVIVTNADIARSSVIPGATPSQFWIDVRLNSAGAEKMRQATTNHIGKPVAIIIDGDVVSAPTVKSPIGGAAVISCDCTRADAERIVNGMAITP